MGAYRSARTRRAYAGDLAAWLDWLRGLDVDVMPARRVRDLWSASSSTPPPPPAPLRGLRRVTPHPGWRVVVDQAEARVVIEALVDDHDWWADQRAAWTEILRQLVRRVPRSHDVTAPRRREPAKLRASTIS